jgi:hypothetical protein
LEELMMTRLLGLVMIVLTAGFIFGGCNAQKDAGPPASADSTGQHDADGHDHDHASSHHDGDAGHDHAAMTADKTEIEAAMAKLSAADRKLAEEQKICPVSDEPLGSMGTPIKVTVEGREVFVCCEGCVDALKENFDKYAAKLGNETAQQ